MIWEQITALDQHLSSTLHSRPNTCGFLEYFVAAFAVAFNPLVLPLLWIAALCFLPFTSQVILVSIGQIIVLLGLTTLLKRLFARRRPHLNPARGASLLYNFRSREKNCSMPSGDAAQAGLYWTFLVLHTGIPIYVAGVCVLGTMYARVFYMCHYWSDTVVGAMLGAGLAVILQNFIQ